MIRRIAAALAAIAVASAALGLAPVPAAATGFDGSEVTIYEWSDGINDVHGDHTLLQKSHGSIPTFQHLSTGLFLGCDNLANNWTNCISGVDLFLWPGTCLRFYDGDYYGGSALAVYYRNPDAGSPLDLVQGWYGLTRNNRASSMIWGDWEATGFGDYTCLVGPY